MGLVFHLPFHTHPLCHQSPGQPTGRLSGPEPKVSIPHQVGSPSHSLSGMVSAPPSVLSALEWGALGFCSTPCGFPAPLPQVFPVPKLSSSEYAICFLLGPDMEPGCLWGRAQPSVDTTGRVCCWPVWARQTGSRSLAPTWQGVDAASWAAGSRCPSGLFPTQAMPSPAQPLQNGQKAGWGCCPSRHSRQRPRSGRAAVLMAAAPRPPLAAHTCLCPTCFPSGTHRRGRTV